MRTSRPSARRAAHAAVRPVVLFAATLLLASSLQAQRRGGGGPGGPVGGPMGSGFAGNANSPFENRRMAEGSIAPIRIEPQLGPPSRWWDDKKTIKHLGLRNDQQHRMDDIFESNRQQLATLLGNLQREESRLVSLPPGDLQDEAKVFSAIDRVAQARAELEKAHAHILLQIRQQLDPQQLAMLDRDMASARLSN